MKNGENPIKDQEYRNKIIDIIKNLENEKVLEFTYNLLVSFKKKWGI